MTVALSANHKQIEYTPQDEVEMARVKCCMFELSYYDEYDDKLVPAWAPEGCHRTALLAIGEPTDWRWRGKFRGVYAFCPACNQRWVDRFDQPSIADLMEGV